MVDYNLRRPLSHAEAVGALAGHTTRKVQNNTLLRRAGVDCAVRWHGVDLVTITPGDRYVLRAPERTPAAMQRLNTYAPVRILRRGTDWWVACEEGLVRFTDGLTVDREGHRCNVS